MARRYRTPGRPRHARNGPFWALATAREGPYLGAVLARLAAALVLLSASACAAPGFLAHQGRVEPPGGFRVALGAGYQVNTSAADLVRRGRDVADALAGSSACPEGSGRCWRREDVEPVVDAALRLALLAPLASRTEISGRYGFAPGFDVGLHLGGGSRSIDAGWQLFGPRDRAVPGWAGTLIGGVGTRSLGAFGSVIERVLRGDASVTEYQAAFIAGRQWAEVAHVYLGARYTLSRWRLDVVPNVPILYDSGERAEALLGTDTRGVLHSPGAVIGGALGYRHAFIGAELNVLATRGSARVLSRERDLDGVAIMPAAYVFTQF
jgi:hypothetical protein